MSKRIKYFILIGVLLVVNLFLFFNKKTTKNRSFDDAIFVLKDTAAVAEIKIQNPTSKIALIKGQNWQVNQNYQANNYFVKILLSAMNRMTVFRKIGKWNGETKGTVEFNSKSANLLSFEYATNPTFTKSYFIKDGDAYEVGVPGYREQITSFFDLNEDQWRDRLLFEGNWRTIQKIGIKYTDKDSLTLKFEDKFFLLNGKTDYDSTKLINYLNQFKYFQVNERVSKGRMPNLDSLSETANFLAEIEISDIKLKKPFHFYIYPATKGAKFHLIKDGKGELSVLDSRRVKSILKKAKDFKIR